MKKQSILTKLPTMLKSRSKQKKQKKKLERAEEEIKDIFEQQPTTMREPFASHDSGDSIMPDEVMSQCRLSGIEKAEASLMDALQHRPQVDVAFRDIGFDVYSCVCDLSKPCFRQRNRILEDVNGVFWHGELTAIMGPSGAGKSTALDIISGFRITNTRGTIFVNGCKVRPEKLRRVACYIMQEDELMPFLSVMEYMNMSANLKLGSGVDKAVKKKIINGILVLLRLCDAKYTRVNHLSGGETKRLAIALELVSNPSVLYLDEPTSGLDSANCTYVVALLKNLAKNGRTIICTIHQPPERVFFLFDKVMLLAKGGKIVYFDRPDGMLSFFSRFGLTCPRGHNPADYAVELAGGAWQDAPLGDLVRETKTLIKSRLDQITNQELTIELVPDVYMLNYPANCCQQFNELIVRTLKGMLRDLDLLQLRLYGMVFIGILIGCTYYDVGDDPEKMLDNMGMLFFVLMYNGFAGMLPSILCFPTEVNVFRREHINFWYSMKLYYLASTVGFLVPQVIFPTLFTIVFYYMTSQPPETSRFLKVLLVMILVSVLCESYGLVFGCALAPKSAVYIAPTTMIPFILFSGFLISVKHLPKFIKWMSYVSFFRYGFEALANAIYKDRDFECKESIDCTFPNAEVLLKRYGLELDFYVDVLVLCAIMLVTRISAFFVMWLKVKTSR